MDGDGASRQQFWEEGTVRPEPRRDIVFCLKALNMVELGSEGKDASAVGPEEIRAHRDGCFGRGRKRGGVSAARERVEPRPDRPASLPFIRRLST